MKTLRKLSTAALLAIALTLPGCILTSGQFLATFDLTNPLTIAGSNSVQGVVVDLNSVADYEDHKDKLKGVLDLAFLGEFEHLSGTAVNIDVWMTRSASSHVTAAAVMGASDAVRVWGPFGLGVGATERITWDRSAELFDDAGAPALIEEVRGDGVFTLYALGAGTLYSFRIHNGSFAVILDAGL